MWKCNKRTLALDDLFQARLALGNRKDIRPKAAFPKPKQVVDPAKKYRTVVALLIELSRILPKFASGGTERYEKIEFVIARISTCLSLLTRHFLPPRLRFRRNFTVLLGVYGAMRVCDPGFCVENTFNEQYQRSRRWCSILEPCVIGAVYKNLNFE